jgi:plasmid maintenance system antidote protein VapI
MVQPLVANIVRHPTDVFRDDLFSAEITTAQLAEKSGISEEEIIIVMLGQAPITEEFANKTYAIMKKDPALILKYQADYEMEWRKFFVDFNGQIEVEQWCQKQ